MVTHQDVALADPLQDVSEKGIEPLSVEEPK